MSRRLALALAAALAAIPLSRADILPPAPAAPATNPDEAADAPVAITVRAEELGALLEGAGWVHKGEGRTPLYTVGFRSCPDCVALKQGAAGKLEEAGADIRNILYARADRDGKERSKPGERAMIAEIWKTRSNAELERWYETDPDTFYAVEPLPPNADADPERAAYVQRSRDFVAKLDEILQANGVPLFVPAIFWRENGVWQVYIGYDPATFDAIVLPRIRAS